MKAVTWTTTTVWDDLVRQAEEEEVVLVRDGHAVALLIPFDDDDLQWYSRERAPDFLASIEKARRQVQQGNTLSHRDLKKELGIE